MIDEDRKDDAQDHLTAVSRWIDEHNAHRTPLEQLLLRMVKIPEEKGEMASEVIGMTGQNPRKGITSDIDKVIDEALDWAVTALGIVEHATGNQCLAFDLLFKKLEKIDARRQAAPSADEIPSDVKIDKALEKLDDHYSDHIKDD